MQLSINNNVAEEEVTIKIFKVSKQDDKEQEVRLYEFTFLYNQHTQCQLTVTNY